MYSSPACSAITASRRVASRSSVGFKETPNLSSVMGCSFSPGSDGRAHAASPGVVPLGRVAVPDAHGDAGGGAASALDGQHLGYRIANESGIAINSIEPHVKYNYRKFGARHGARRRPPSR